MIEVTGDIWDFYEEGYWLAITTNGFVKKNGECVMGAGIAKQAAKRFPDLPLRLGSAIRALGYNTVLPAMDLRLISFPVKHNWFEMADLALITQSAMELAENATLWFGADAKIAMVRPGCGNGQLEWTEVREVIAPILSDDRFIIVDNGSGERSKEWHRVQRS
jgi:hypothetical protein